MNIKNRDVYRDLGHREFLAVLVLFHNHFQTLQTSKDTFRRIVEPRPIEVQWKLKRPTFGFWECHVAGCCCRISLGLAAWSCPWCFWGGLDWWWGTSRTENWLACRGRIKSFPTSCRSRLMVFRISIVFFVCHIELGARVDDQGVPSPNSTMVYSIPKAKKGRLFSTLFWILCVCNIVGRDSKPAFW